MTRLDIAATIPTARTRPARIHNAVGVPTQATRKTTSVSTPITMRGKPIETATPTCLMGLKLVDPLFLREPSLIAPNLRRHKDIPVIRPAAHLALLEGLPSHLQSPGVRGLGGRSSDR